jgi:fimbrial chaperone protein
MSTFNWNIMSTHGSNTKRALCGALLFAAATICSAGSIQMTPVRVDLSAGAKIAIVTVHNTGTETSVMQVTLNKWTSDGQQYAYKQSQELVITPVTFRLAPGKQQIVRIGLRGSPPKTDEGSYRLLVEEVPPPATLASTGTRLIVRHDLPVFVAPFNAAKAQLDIAVDCAADGARLRLTNTGNVHAQLRNVVLEDSAAKQSLGSWETYDYLLPSAQKSWGLAQVAPTTSGKSFVVTALTDQGSFTADVKNTCS